MEQKYALSLAEGAAIGVFPLQTLHHAHLFSLFHSLRVAWAGNFEHLTFSCWTIWIAN
ncbi:MAG: hypothetical protein P8X46_06185 [Nitrospirales bacterium]